MISWERAHGISSRDKQGSLSANNNDSSTEVVIRSQGWSSATLWRSLPSTNSHRQRQGHFINNDLFITKPKEPQKLNLTEVTLKYFDRMMTYMDTYQLAPWITSLYSKFKGLKYDEQLMMNDISWADDFENFLFILFYLLLLFLFFIWSVQV